MDKAGVSFEQYYEDVLRFLRGLSRDEYLAEELTQETIYRAMKSIQSFRGDSDLRIWLCSIAKNIFLTYKEKQQRITLGIFYTSGINRIDDRPFVAGQYESPNIRGHRR